MPTRTRAETGAGKDRRIPKPRRKDRGAVTSGDANGQDAGAQVQEERQVVYPRKELRDRGILYEWRGCYGEKAMTVQQSKDLLDWTEVASTDEWQFRDRHGKYIFCANNTTNREIVWKEVEKLVQVHLTRRYRFNGEDILIGRYGRVLNGQKSMIAHVLAEQDRLIDLEGPRKWVRYWQGPITMEKGVKLGIDESDEVVDTLDTAQPRTMNDAMYRSEYLRHMPSKLRSAASKISGYAVKLVWSRTGAGPAAFAPFATHDTLAEFLGRHPNIVKAIKWVAEENEAKVEFPNADGKTRRRGKVELIIETSRAAALLYLMGMSATVSDVYRYAQPDPSEEAADDSRWDQAEDFWSGLVGGSPDLEPVRVALGLLVDEETGRPPSADEKITVLWKAWQRFVKKKPIVGALLKPRYTRRAENEPKTLVNEWDFGGIDIIRKMQAEKAAPARPRPGAAAPDDPDDPANETDADLEPDGGDDQDDAGELRRAGAGASQGATADTRDPTPAEIRMLLGKNGAMDDESPEAERLRRERIEREAELRKEQEAEQGKRPIRRLKDVPPR